MHQRGKREGAHPERVVDQGRNVFWTFDAACKRVRDVEVPIFVAPENSFRQARRAAGVDEIEVVTGARFETTLDRFALDRILERNAGTRRFGGRRVFENDIRLDARELCCKFRHAVCELSLVDQCNEVGLLPDDA